MPTERVYSAGDRVIFLGRGSAEHVGTLQNFGPPHFTANSLRERPFIVAEGVVSQVMDHTADRDKYPPGRQPSNTVYVKYQAEENEMYEQDFHLRQRYLSQLTQLVELGMTNLELPEAQKIWMRSLIYPVVVTSQGYNKLLTDLLLLARPEADAAALRKADTEEIIAKCAQFGLTYVPINRQYLTTRWAAADKVEEAGDPDRLVKKLDAGRAARNWALPPPGVFRLAQQVGQEGPFNGADLAPLALDDLGDGGDLDDDE
jgi:hypothetical protein